MEDTFTVSRHTEESKAIDVTDSTIENFIHFPAQWLVARIEHVLEEDSPEPLTFPIQDPDSPFGKLIAEQGLSQEESALLCLALAASFSPELLGSLAVAATACERLPPAAPPPVPGRERRCSPHAAIETTNVPSAPFGICFHARSPLQMCWQIVFPCIVMLYLHCFKSNFYRASLTLLIALSQ